MSKQLAPTVLTPTQTESSSMLAALRAFATAATLCCGTLVHAACALSPEPHPHGVVGLQLFYPDDPRSWAWAGDLQLAWLRIEMRWDWIEPNKDQFDASYVDKVMALARVHPQRIMLLFNHPPRWVAREPDTLPDRAAVTVAWLVKRYGTQIHAWELFNEPNLPGYGWPDLWPTAQGSAITYARTLATASSAIRSIDKHAFVVSAGLSPQNDPESYARVVVRLTPPDCYDALGLHPYGQQGRFAAVQNNVTTLFQQEDRPRKPVWFTEYGTDQNGERAQLIRQLGVEASSVPITFFFAERDIGRLSDTYGLRRHDGSAKPDYLQFKQIVTAKPRP